MLRFETKRYKCSTFKEPSCVPALSYSREKFKAKSTIEDYEGLFIDYGYRETAYPYTLQNLYEDEVLQNVNVAILENDFMYAEFLVDFGGRLWKLYDKTMKKDVLYTNDVIRMRNLSVRNAWFSGGVEWNCGIIGHTPFTCSKMYCAKVSGLKNEDVLRFYEFERVRSIYYQVDFWLEENRLMVAVNIENPNNEVVPMYWWSNMATPEYKGGRVAVPASSAYNNSDGMGIKKSSIPIDKSVDVSYPKNIPDTIDYFYDIQPQDSKFIANVDADGYGLLQFSSNRLKGRKLFSWGHMEGSAHWQEMLTDTAGSYVEIQAGLGKTQYECIPMPPKTSWGFLECYTLANIGKTAVKGDYNKLIKAVSRQIESIFSSNDMDSLFEDIKKSIIHTKGKLVQAGSGFGYIENCLGGNAPKHLEFLSGSDGEPWKKLIENGEMTANCSTFAFGGRLENLLSKHEESLDWQITYQLALVSFDSSNFKKAKELCEKSMVLDNNYLNNHLYAFILYHLEDDNFSYYAIKCMKAKPDCYAVCESIIKLLLESEKYKKITDIFPSLGEEMMETPRLKMYLAMAYLKQGDANTAEDILLSGGGLKLLDFREGDRFLDILYRGIRKHKYNEKEKDVTVPKQFDFIVSRGVLEYE